jgi:hypothetical protein
MQTNNYLSVDTKECLTLPVLQVAHLGLIKNGRKILCSVYTENIYRQFLIAVSNP